MAIDKTFNVPCDYVKQSLRKSKEASMRLSASIKVQLIAPVTLSVQYNTKDGQELIHSSVESIESYIKPGEKYRLLNSNDSIIGKNGKKIKTLSAVPFPTSGQQFAFHICETSYGPYLYISPSQRNKCLKATKPQTIKQIRHLIEMVAIADFITNEHKSLKDDHLEYDSDSRVDDYYSQILRLNADEIKNYSGYHYLSVSSLRIRINQAIEAGILKKHKNMITQCSDELFKMPPIERQEGEKVIDFWKRSLSANDRNKIRQQLYVENEIKRHKRYFLRYNSEGNPNAVVKVANSYTVRCNLYGSSSDNVPTVNYETKPIVPVADETLMQDVVTSETFAKEVCSEIELFPTESLIGNENAPGKLPAIQDEAKLCDEAQTVTAQEVIKSKSPFLFSNKECNSTTTGITTSKSINTLIGFIENSKRLLDFSEDSKGYTKSWETVEKNFGELSAFRKQKAKSPLSSFVTSVTIVFPYLRTDERHSVPHKLGTEVILSPLNFQEKVKISYTLTFKHRKTSVLNKFNAENMFYVMPCLFLKLYGMSRQSNNHCPKQPIVLATRKHDANMCKNWLDKTDNISIDKQIDELSVCEFNG